jgi:hypothetical protein
MTRNGKSKIGDRVIADCLFNGGIQIGIITKVVKPGGDIETEIEIKNDKRRSFRAKSSSAKSINRKEEDKFWLDKFKKA